MNKKQTENLTEASENVEIALVVDNVIVSL